ncbi:DNA polymerase III subunit epsilon [Corynebacterium aurimucosum]|uniref:DNA polymerase III subunit epsilon n=1 Tax=Corynebacterium aurimucosum TaxID=169292 RepID=A0A558GJA9_9CORY|nr:exonuclease domain-containing protein [Corynebacterium sp. HMSC072D12]OFQ36174.1 DNA polymerase III subunit epsilon [Corynebacterium sp. HMSC072D12]TVU56918.1 DNA polymerase III subunit epsilon [Corynebacterium aurimucosum]
MSYTAHGAVIDVTTDALTVQRSQLAASLGAPAREALSLADATGVECTKPTETGFGQVIVRGTSDSAGTVGDTIIRFAPGQDAAAFARAVEAALRGEAPAASSGVQGLNFTAVDVETANDNWGSVCQIGAVRFRDGEETESRTWLCTPPPGLEHFDEVNISIHGITAEDVADTLPFADAAAELFEFLGTDTLVAHNAQFDSTALRSGLKKADAPVPELRLACSLALARDASRAGVIDVANHKLPTVASYLGAEDFRHHEATADARAAGEIVSALAQRFGHSGSIEDLFTTRDFALGTLSEDSVIPVLRANTAPLSAADLGAGTDFRDKTRMAGTASGSKKKGSAAKERRGAAPWQSVSTPDTIPDPNPDADPEGALFAQNVTLTGDFEPFDKGLLWSKIAERGGQVGKNVTKKTTVLVVGQWATKTSKEKRAEELQGKGQDIAIWQTDKLLEELQLDEAPPF